MKLVITAASLLVLFTLTGCPGKVDPSQENSGLGSASGSWGLPMVHTTTAGFNGASKSHDAQAPAQNQK